MNLDKTNCNCYPLNNEWCTVVGSLLLNHFLLYSVHSASAVGTSPVAPSPLTGCLPVTWMTYCQRTRLEEHDERYTETSSLMRAQTSLGKYRQVETRLEKYKHLSPLAMNTDNERIKWRHDY